MTFSTPIDTNDLNDLPDNTDLIEDLNQKDKITTVLPRFLGNNDTGRFVTAFFVFKGTSVFLYTRQRTSNGESSLEKQTRASLTNHPTILGDTWNQTILIEDEDIETVERLKQRVEYDTYWLSFGHEPAIPFDEYKHDPFGAQITGLPECDHTEAQDPVKAPNLDLTITLCKDCNLPLMVASPSEVFEVQEVLRPEYVGIPSEGNPVKGKRVNPDDPLSNAEVSLHVLSRFAHVEQSHLDIYARNDDYGYLITLDNSIAGYALWNEFGDHVALQQVYIFPEFRGADLGEILVNAWSDQLDIDHYYAIGPNEAGLTTLEKAGHIDDGTATPATILSCRDTLDSSAVNASFADRVRRGDNPFQS